MQATPGCPQQNESLKITSGATNILWSRHLYLDIKAVNFKLAEFIWRLLAEVSRYQHFCDVTLKLFYLSWMFHYSTTFYFQSKMFLRLTKKS